jgi:hypothetical protein
MSGWTHKRVECLEQLHKEGFSATVIAKKLGPSFTKGMVAGKIRRLGLTVTPAKKKARAIPEARPLSRPRAMKPNSPQPSAAPATIIVPRAVPRTPTPPVGVAVSNGIRIYDLRARHCRWPLGDDRPAKFFCGAPVVPSKSWCEHHYGLAYGHRPTHQNREREGSPGQMLLRALQRRSKWRQVEAVQRST